MSGWLLLGEAFFECETRVGRGLRVGVLSDGVVGRGRGCDVSVLGGWDGM